MSVLPKIQGVKQKISERNINDEKIFKRNINDEKIYVYLLNDEKILMHQLFLKQISKTSTPGII